MIFPIGDTQVTGPFKPIFSYGLIVVNVIIFILQLMTPGQLICEFAVIPGDIVRGDSYFTLFSSMFLHGGIMHLVGNMVFLWIFGDNIEVKIGNWQFLFFYLIGGLIGTWAHIVFNLPNSSIADCCMPCSEITCSGNIPGCQGFIPSLGASGAISAVMGAYLVMFPKSKVKMLVLIFFRSFYIPAFLFLGFWFIQQLYSGVGQAFANVSGAGTAWWAHIGGFAFGILAGFYFKKRKLEKRTKSEYFV